MSGDGKLTMTWMGGMFTVTKCSVYGQVPTKKSIRFPELGDTQSSPQVLILKWSNDLDDLRVPE
jgi:hypothetical protein